MGDAFAQGFAEVVTRGRAKKIQLAYQPVLQLSSEWNGWPGDHSADSFSVGL